MIRSLIAALAALWVTSAHAEGPCTLMSVDDYLFSLYERAPKIDSGGYFGYKDEEAAAHAHMTLKEYVIGGMSPALKEKLARALFAAEVRGLKPAINSAFRDDFRQALITQRFKAKVGLSFHGGSRRGGWGHGMAADTVSEDAIGPLKARLAASQPLWKYLDEHSQEFGLGRPYRRVDPSHIALLSSGEMGKGMAKKAKRIARRTKRHMHVAHM